MRTRLATVVGTVAVAATGLAGCTSAGSSAQPLGDPNDHSPVTITMWSGYTDRELKALGATLDRFHASHPWITVKNVGAIDDDKIVKAIRGGNAAEVTLSFTPDKLGSYCASGAWIDLGAYLKRDRVDLGVIPRASQAYTTYNGHRCAMPALADAYGLYYNKDLLARAGYTAPPKTASELVDMAVRLTSYNPDGSIRVAGFVPLWGFYEMSPSTVAPNWGATWTDPAGRSNLAKDPHWAAMLRWQKQFVDRIGYTKLKRFTAGAGSSEFSASNFFETGKIAMAIDGEWRVAFIHSDKPALRFGTAPFPVDDAQPGLYGAGYVAGNLVGIPKTTSGKRREAAWQLVRWLATDTAAQAGLATTLRNVPTVTAALSDPALTADREFATFLRIYAHPKTGTIPITAAGSANQDLFATFTDKYQSGSAQDLAAGLKATDRQIDAQLAQAAGKGAP